MKNIHFLLSLILTLTLSLGQVWGEDVTVSFASWTTGVSAYSATEWTDNGCTFTYANNNNKGWAYVRCGGKGTTASSTIKYNTAVGVPVESVVLNTSNKISNGSSSSITITGVEVAAYSNSSFTTLVSSENLGTLSYTSSNCPTSITITPTTAWAKDLYYKITISWTATGSKNCGLNVSGITFNEYEEIPSPSVTVSPTSWDFGTVHASAETSKEFSVSGSNLTAGTLTIEVPSGYSVSPNSISVSAGTLAATKVTVSKNTTTIGSCNGNLSISGGGLASAKTVALTMTVDADPAETGTFKLFSGDLSEGDYVFVVGGKAMTNTVSSNRLTNTDVTISSDNKITNPDEAIIWHVAATGNHWTIYNTAIAKYVAATGTKNQASVTATEDDKILWSVEESSGSYHFDNKYNSGLSTPVNSKLQRNGDYGWACYAAYSDIQLFKLDDGAPSAPTFSPAGGSFLDAQNVTLSAETGATIYYTTDGTAPTTSSSVYSAAIPVSETTTIKAIAVKDEKSSSLASASYTITTPLSVAAAIALIPNADDVVDNQYIEGFVCTAGTSVSSGKMTYYISADGSETNRLQIYKGKNLDNTDFSAVGNLAVGDKVIVLGQLKNYGGTPEMNDGNYVVRYTAKGALQSVVVSGTPTKTVYANGETFDPAGLVVTATYASGYAINVAADVTTNSGWTASPTTVTASGDIAVTATYGGQTSVAYNVAVEKASKTLVSIAIDEDEFEQWQGLELPKPTVTATFSEGDPQDVTAQAEFTGYDASTTGDQTITVSYTFGGNTETETYNVTVKPIYNVELAASVAHNLIINVVGNAGSGDNEMIIRGVVLNPSNPSNNAQTYYISDDGTNSNTVEVFKGKYLENASFTASNKLIAGDEVVVKGKVTLYNSTPEFSAGAILQSLARTPNFEIANVSELEVGATDLAVADLSVNQDGGGAITLSIASEDASKATIVNNKIHAVDAGTVTVTASLAANGIYKAATTTFTVTIIVTAQKYAISFDGNGADGGTAPDAIADKAEGAPVTLPENAWTKTDKIFNGWKVINNTTTEEVTVTAGAFTMPASAVTIQAQWADPSEWALRYTSDVAITFVSNGSNDKVSIGGTEYVAAKAGTGSKDGQVKVTVPAGTHKLHFHAITWNNAADIVITASGVSNMSQSTFTLKADAGATGSGTYALSGIPYMQYYSFTFDAVESETEISFAKTSGAERRFIIYGVNQEGGAVPVLDHIAITGTMTNTTGWKTGDNITPEGLTVNAIYTLNSVEQTPVDVTSSVTWSHAALTEGQTEVTLTATYTEGEVVKTANTNVTIEPVETGDPTIITDPTTYLNFGTSVEKDAVVAAKTITVTLKNITSATATLGGTNYSAFSIDKTAITDGTVITVSVNTGTVDVYAGTVTIKDDNSDTEKVINLSMTVVEPEVAEEAVSTTSKWIAATEVVDGMQVLITGVKNNVVYAISEQGNNNRTTAAGSLDAGFFTPGDNTMAFTLVEQSEGKYALRTSNGKYLYASSSSANQLKTRDAVGDDGKAVWTISINNDKEASIVANCEIANWRNTMQFNPNGSNAPVVACYATASQSPITLYTNWVSVRTGLTAGNYYTVCYPKAMTAIRGGLLYSIEGKDANSVYMLQEDAPLVAGRPYILYATSEKLEAVVEGSDASADSHNGLYGTLSAMTADDLATAGATHMLYDNSIRPLGTNNHLAEGRAYIILSEIPVITLNAQEAPGRVRAIPMHGNVATDIEATGLTDKPAKVMMDGQLFILRGERLYDMTGRLVK